MRAALLTDGPSDRDLGSVVERVAQLAGIDLTVSAMGRAELSSHAAGWKVEERIRALLSFDDSFDAVCIHRDAESKEPEPRYEEIREAVVRSGFSGPVVPVVPVRMTEAWLLLDETIIRAVAGAPSRTNALSLPSAREAERMADAKACLQRTLIVAAGSPTGRNLVKFRSQFGSHRAQLLRRLDPRGPVSDLPSFQRLVDSITALRN